jgi:hypothetical protein
VKTGVQIVYNHSKILNSGFRRNDGKTNFKTFYEVNNFPADSFWLKKIINSFWSRVDLGKSIYKILATGRISGQNINGSGGENIRSAIAKG